MVLGWRRAFCTSVPKERDSDENQHCNSNNPKISSKLGFFSNPSTPRLPLSNSSVPTSPTLHTKPQTPKKNSSESPRLFNPSSPSFSLLKSTLRISTKRSVCGICSEAVKSGNEPLRRFEDLDDVSSGRNSAGKVVAPLRNDRQVRQ